MSNKYSLSKTYLSPHKSMEELNMINLESTEVEHSSATSIFVEEDRQVSIPIKVEPKVFFANERTFLKWIQFAIFLGGIGTAMLGLGDHYAAGCGVLLIFTAVLFAVYALYLFNWRSNKITSRDPGPYEDTVGPYVLVSAFVLVLIISTYFRFPLIKKFE